MPESPKIFIGVPLFKGVSHAFVNSFIDFLFASTRQYAVEKPYLALNKPNDMARNEIVKAFLASDCSHLLFVDQDSILQRDLLDKLLSHDKDVISALYFTKEQRKPVAYRLENGRLTNLQNYNLNSLESVNGIGLGCCLIKRHVIEGLKQKLVGKPMFAIVLEDRNNQMSEDIYFSLLLAEHGFQMHVDTGCKIGHFGGVVYGP